MFMKKAKRLNSKGVSILLLSAAFAVAMNAKSILFAHQLPHQKQKIQTGYNGEASRPDKGRAVDPSSLELSLKDVTNIALDNSLDIQIAKLDVYIERLSLKKENSIFDTFLSASISYNRDKRMQASTVFGTETKEHEFSFGLEKRTPTGTTFSLDTIGTKKRTNSIFSTLNPYNEARIELSITQKLGKNFFGLADRSKIKVTKIDIENSEFTSLGDIEDILSEVQKAYWRLVLEEEQLEIRKDMLFEAEKLYKIYKDKFSLGLVEESELLAVEALVYTRKASVSIAGLKRQTAKNNLLFLINKGNFKQEIKPKEELSSTSQRVDLAQALIKAIASRRDYRRAINEIKKNNIDLVVKKNALWPQIDLEASLNRNNLNLNRLQAWEDATRQSNDEVFVGLTIKIPFENTEAKAELKEAEFNKRKVLLELKRVERLILKELNNKVSRVNVIQNQVQLYEETVKIHEKKLKHQIKRLKFGRSDSDTLLRYEEDLLNTRLELVDYLFQYKVSFIELELAQNTLLDKYWKDSL